MPQAPPPIPVTVSDRRIARTLPIFVLLTGLLLSAFGATDLGLLGILVGVVACIWVVNPSAFIGLMMGVYGSVQFILQDSFQIRVGAFSLSASKLFVAFVTSLFLLRLLVGLVARSRYVGTTRSQVAYLLFVLWSLLSAAHIYNGSEVATILARLVACGAAMWFSFVFVRHNTDFLWLCAGAAIAVGISSLVALHSFAQGDVFDVIRVGAFRALGGFGGAVVTGTVAFFGIALSICALASRLFIERWRPLWLALLAAGSIGIVTTFTRTAIVGTLIFLVLYVFSPSHTNVGTMSRGRRVLVSGLFLVGFFGAFSLVSEDAVQSRLSDIPGLSGGGDVAAEAGSGRGLIWRVVLISMSQATPMEWALGHGIASVPLVVQRSTGLLLGAHNSYLEVLHDSGLIGATLYILFALLLLKDLRAAARAATPPLRTFALLWHHYCAAYFLSTVMFNGYVYMIGPTWFTMIISGALLGLVRNTTTRIDPTTVRQPVDE